jgi:hypothetical protein
MYRTKVLISNFEQQKLTSLNIRIASFLRVAETLRFYLFVCMCLVLRLTNFQHSKT